MDWQSVESASVAELARIAGVHVEVDDLDLLTQALRRYAEVFSPLQRAELAEIAYPPSDDPRVGW